MSMIRNTIVLLMLGSFVACSTSQSLTDFDTAQPPPEKLKALIVDGQNNHNVWPKSTHMMKQMLEQTDRFEVSVYRTTNVWKSERFIHDYSLNDGKTYVEGEPQTNSSFTPNFSDYDVVVSNFGWKAADWPKSTQEAFEKYMFNGGGLVVIHAADNSFPSWTAYNQMIGLGGWGGRNEQSGPYLYFDEGGELIRDYSAGGAGGHGQQHEFTVQMRSEHPITKGMPLQWMQSKDELYNRLRGPAQNITVLASAYDSKDVGGFGRHEPVLMVIHYGQGRVFHSTLGHDVSAFESVGFQNTFQRGTEWAGSGEVTIPVPADFLSATK